MVVAVTKISSWSCSRLEASLLPVNGGTMKKVANYACQFFEFCLQLPLAIASSSLSYGLRALFPQPSQDPPLIAFAKRSTWASKPVEAAPVDIGFASADFQDNGPMEHPNTNWGDFYRKNFGDLGQAPDIWHHPERVIDRLKELGCKSYRFSVSRDKQEPLDIQRYRNFIRELKKNGIEPMATLHHFSDPIGMHWERAEDIDGFVRYANDISEMLYEEGVRKVITLNEPSVMGTHGFVMGEFPPQHTLDFEGMARALENMMRAHVKVYESLKARHPDFEIGMTHDPVRFRYFHKHNPLFSPPERLMCHYLSESYHGALMRFLQTGKFSLKVPFRTNYSFELPGKPPLDFIGLQYYSDPLLKISFTGGESVTRIPEETISSYQIRMYPQGLASAIEEFRSLNIPIDLTEIGLDTGVMTDASDKERIAYFDRIFQVVQKALDEGAQVRSLYFWTLIDNLEWYKAWAVRFGFYHFDEKTGAITPRPVAAWLKGQIAARDAVSQAV